MDAVLLLLKERQEQARRAPIALTPNRTPWAGCDFSPEESITAGPWRPVRSSDDVLTFFKIIWPHPTLLGSFRSLGGVDAAAQSVEMTPCMATASCALNSSLQTQMYEP